MLTLMTSEASPSYFSRVDKIELKAPDIAQLTNLEALWNSSHQVIMSLETQGAALKIPVERIFLRDNTL